MEKAEKKATNTKNKFFKDVCKYALYAIGVLGIYTALEYGIFAHYIEFLVCSYECIGGTHVNVHR